MAILAVPPVLNGAGELVPARLFIRLVLANGTSAIGFVGTDLVTEFQNLPIPLEGLEVELTPQASIALESGEATYYEVRIQTAHRTEQFVIQLADSVTPQELEALVGAAAIDPGTIVIGVVVDDTPVNGSTTTAISSNWAYDHVAAADPHPGYALESGLGTAAATDVEDYATASQGSLADTAVQPAVLLGALTPSELALTTAVWDDLRFPAQAINPAGAAAPPTVDTDDGTLEFSASQQNIIAGVAQLPHTWKEGSTIFPHIHWCPTTTNVGNVYWRFEYEIQNRNGTFVGYTTSNTIAASDGTAEKHLTHHLTAAGIDMTGKEISCIMKWRLSRMGAEVTDTFTGTARLLEFDIHYQIDTLGSAEEMTK